MNYTEKTLFGIPLPTGTKNDIREKILKDAESRGDWKMIMSLNPEIIEIARGDSEFKKVILSSNYHILDGVGVVLAAQTLNIPHSERYSGVDMMDDLIGEAFKRRLTVMLIGGKGNVANKLSDCYSDKYPGLNIQGVEGYENNLNQTKEETQRIISIVASVKPHLIFVAFGSPVQEMWLYKNRAQLGNAVCAGVGGAFDFLSGNVSRAPQFIRTLGLEWAYRLFTQPWRWKRQVRLLNFVLRVLRVKFQ